MYSLLNHLTVRYVSVGWMDLTEWWSILPECYRRISESRFGPVLWVYSAHSNSSFTESQINEFSSQVIWKTNWPIEYQISNNLSFWQEPATSIKCYSRRMLSGPCSFQVSTSWTGLRDAEDVSNCGLFPYTFTWPAVLQEWAWAIVLGYIEA
jgi:hypothetical protein